MKKFSILLLSALTAFSAAGCRNPFDPEADVVFDRFFCGSLYSPVLLIDRKLVTNGTLYTRVQAGQLFVAAQFLNFSSVYTSFVSYTVVYRDVYTGAPISSCGGAAGRRFYSSFLVNALANNTSSNTSTATDIAVVTNELLDHIKNNAYTINGGIDCEISFAGVDGNDHDIKVDATLHIEVYE